MIKLLLLCTVACFFSFHLPEPKKIEFDYPKRKGTGISFSADHFKKFSKEWRGEDYYYYANEDGFICSVLYYKLNKNEIVQLIDAPKAAIGGPDKSPAYPYAYFKNYSNLKSMERNDSSWGGPADAFMFRQNNVVVEGMPIVQKNMYGYAMVDKDLFVNVHLSKTPCTPADSTEMMRMLQSVKLNTAE